MKRFLILFVILGLAVGSATTAEAGRKNPERIERTVEGSYDTQFVPFGGLVTHTCAQTRAKGCVTIATLTEESFFTAKVVDAHGQPVFVTVYENTDPYGGNDNVFGTFCGETEEPIAFDPGAELIFSIGYFWLELPNSLASCPPMFGTTGTVSVTLSNLP